MKCVTCKNGTCKKGFATKLFEKNGSLIILKQVPALICDNCGAKYFDGKTSAMMLKKSKIIKAKRYRNSGSKHKIVSRLNILCFPFMVL